METYVFSFWRKFLVLYLEKCSFVFYSWSSYGENTEFLKFIYLSLLPHFHILEFVIYLENFPNLIFNLFIGFFPCTYAFWTQRVLSYSLNIISLCFNVYWMQLFFISVSIVIMFICNFLLVNAVSISGGFLLYLFVCFGDNIPCYEFLSNIWKYLVVNFDLGACE